MEAHNVKITKAVKKNMLIKLINAKNIKKFKDCLNPLETNALLADREMGMGCIADDGRGCAVVLFSTTDAIEGGEGKNYLLEHFYVLPEYRNIGCFKEIIHTVMETIEEGRKAGEEIRGLLAQVVYPDMAEAEEAIIHLGFTRLLDGNRIICWRIHQRRKRRIFKNGKCKESRSHDRYRRQKI